MTDGDAPADLRDRLRAICDAPAASGAQRHAARRLLDRMETPLRLAFVGPEPGGRADAIAALVGVELLPDLADRPAVEIAHGRKAETRATDSRGTVVPVADPLDAIRDPDTVLLTVQRPLPALDQLRILDVVTGETPDEMDAALGWAASRADVLVWWSRAFGEAERAAWAGAPAALRDHAFLALRGPAGASPRPDLAGEFVAVFPIDAPGAGAGAGAEPPAGCARLVRALIRHMDHGRQADADAAHAFLAKAAPLVDPAPGNARPRSAPSSAPTPSAEASPPPRPVAPAADSVPHEPVATEPVPPVPQAAPRTSVRPEAAPSPERSALDALGRNASALLRRRAYHLLDDLRADPVAAGKGLVRHCLETLERLSELIDTADIAPDPALDAVSEALVSAEETLLLLEVEGTGKPQEDAVGLMLQIRREVETRFAVQNQPVG